MGGAQTRRDGDRDRDLVGGDHGPTHEKRGDELRKSGEGHAIVLGRKVGRVEGVRLARGGSVSRTAPGRVHAAQKAVSLRPRSARAARLLHEVPVAKPKKLPLPSESAPKPSAQSFETPKIKWNVIAQIAAVVVVVWVFAFLLVPYVGYWGVGVVGVLTLALLGFGVYVWNLTRRQGALAEILKQATTDEAGRKAAIEKLAAAGDSDAMNAMARAQLVARDDPKEAIAILESIQIHKADALIQDDIRANLGYLYLAMNRVKDARAIADQIKYDQGATAKQKAMYAAVVAEAKSRTGDPQDAKRVLEGVDTGDAELAELMPMIARAQVFTFIGTKNRGLARKAMDALVASDPNLLAPFLMTKAATPGEVEMQKMAREVLGAANFQTKQKTKLLRG